MKFNNLITSIGLTFSTALFVSNSAQAVNFTTHLSENQGLRDILLGSIEQNGKTINQFSFVK